MKRSLYKKLKPVNSDNTASGSGSDWLSEDSTKADGIHLIGSDEERARELTFTEQYKNVNLEHDVADIKSGKDKQLSVIDRYRDTRQALIREVSMRRATLRAKQNTTSFKNARQNYIRCRAYKMSPRSVEAARERAYSFVESTPSLEDDKWLERGGFDDLIYKQQVDPRITDAQKDFDRVFGQYEAEF